MQDDVTVHDLKCTIVVAQEGSLSRAAARLHMTQPALGRRVHRVEREVGVRLFYSWYGGLRLSESGKALSKRFSNPSITLSARCNGRAM